MIRKRQVMTLVAIKIVSGLASCRPLAQNSTTAAKIAAVGPLEDSTTARLRAALAGRLATLGLAPSDETALLNTPQEIATETAFTTPPETPWPPTVIETLLNRLLQKIRSLTTTLDDRTQAKAMLAFVRALNDAIDGAGIYACRRVEYSDLMALRMGRHMGQHAAKSPEFASVTRMLYRELILVRDNSRPADCRNTLRVGVARGLINGFTKDSSGTKSLERFVREVVAEAILQLKIEGVSGTPLAQSINEFKSGVVRAFNGETAQIVFRKEIAAILASAAAEADAPAYHAATPAQIIDFVNDSEGSQAKFFWTVIGDVSGVRLAWSQNRQEVVDWDGLTGRNLSAGSLVTERRQCALSYRNRSNGPLEKEDRCGIDLSGFARWGRVHVRLAVELPDSSGVLLSDVRVAGHVPDGMVLVSVEDWPTDTTLYEPVGYDFAIDKYETSLDGGGSFPPDATALAVSRAGTMPATGGSWKDHAAACRNRRTDATFRSWEPQFTRGIDTIISGYNYNYIPEYLWEAIEPQWHLATDNEWFVAAADTPPRHVTPDQAKFTRRDITSHAAQGLARATWLATYRNGPIPWCGLMLESAKKCHDSMTGN